MFENFVFSIPLFHGHKNIPLDINNFKLNVFLIGTLNLRYPQMKC